MRKPALVMVLLLIPSIVGCGNSGQVSQAPPVTYDMNYGLCLSLKQMKTAMTGLRELDPNSTLSEIGGATDALRKSVADLQRSAAGDRGKEVAALNEAFEQVETAVADLPLDMTAAQAVESLADERAAVQSAWAGLVNSIECYPPIEP
jgi:hypothetical protein